MKGSKSLDKVAALLARLPGIGEKSAMRLALHLFRSDKVFIEELSSSLKALKDQVMYCPKCYALTENQNCLYCHDTRRSSRTICVVEDISDLIAIEGARPGGWHYHVLHGVLSPLDGVGPEDIRIKELLTRLQGQDVEEIILATNPSVEGEATALYIAKLLGPLKIKVTRIALGVPMGSQLQYVDSATLGRALEERQKLEMAKLFGDNLKDHNVAY